jgi:phosphoglycolate phosphatase-like HAD superfamily hydrolase
MKKVIIFDFDGTLADSLHIVIQSYNRVATLLRCKPVNEDEVATLRAMHMRDVLKQLRISYFKLPLVLFCTLRLYKRHLREVRLYPGIKHMLQQLHQAGCTLYVVSTNRVDSIKQFFILHGLPQCVGVYSTGSDVFAKSKVIQNILHKKGIDPRDALYVGDELRDIQAAHQAGIEAMGVSWGYNTRSMLAHETHIIADSPEEVTAYVLNRS